MAEKFREIPSPTYDYEVSILVSYYDKALKDLRNELNRIDLTDYQRANVRATRNEIVRILKELDTNALSWVERYLPQAVRDGITRTLIALGVAGTYAEADKIVKFNRLNKELVKTAVADMQTDLMQVSQNIDRKTRNAIREVTAEVMRSNMTQGINGRRTISGDIVKGLQEKLDDSVNTGIVDASNRRWNPKVYADMVARTKMAQTSIEATRNEAIQRDVYYGVISSHGATDACRFHEGRIVKLTPEAPGNYPTVEELRASGQIWHPNCKHHVSPLRKESLLPPDARKKAERQAERGSDALATGKRNPKDID